MDTTHYTLILMIELAQVHKKEGVGITALSEKYNLPDSAFDGIIEGLEQTGYVVHRDERLLKMIQHRLQRQKLSAWSEKASKVFYT